MLLEKHFIIEASLEINNPKWGNNCTLLQANIYKYQKVILAPKDSDEHQKIKEWYLDE